MIITEINRTANEFTFKTKIFTIEVRAYLWREAALLRLRTTVQNDIEVEMFGSGLFHRKNAQTNPKLLSFKNCY